MKKYFVIIVLNLSFFSFGQNCSMLKDGKYETHYDDKNRASNLFEINGSHYYAYQDDTKKDYEIITLGNCSFQLKNNENVDESKLTEFQKIITKQELYFEITKVEGNTYYFVCRINLDVQCGSGKFVKKEE
jgi:hypothetical protein